MTAPSEAISIPGPTNAQLGQRVRRTRKLLDLKQQELADEVGVTSQHISRIELDLTAPSTETLLRLSQTLGVTADYLLTGCETAPLDATGAIRAEPDISAVAKRHLIGVLNELRTETDARARIAVEHR
jgi:transcriptional regulator with XRE-family HTH domain